MLEKIKQLPMQWKIFVGAVVFMTGVLIWTFWPQSTKLNEQDNVPVATPTPVVINSTGLDLIIAKDYAISTYATGLMGIATLRQDFLGHVLATIPHKDHGLVVGIKDGQVLQVLENMYMPYGMDFIDGRLYVSETNQISHFNYNPDILLATDKRRYEIKKPLALSRPGKFMITDPISKKVNTYTQSSGYINNREATYDQLVIRGTKIIRRKFDLNNKFVGEEDFLLGLQNPIDILIHSDKSIYISDGQAGAIYRVLRIE